MKAVFIAYDQAHAHDIIDILDHLSLRGFTRWEQTSGRGSHDGEPHYGTHAWPSLASSILTVVPDDMAPVLLERLRALDAQSPRLGLRAFVWDVTDAL